MGILDMILRRSTLRDAAERERRQDDADFNNELAGREAGRQPRFLPQGIGASGRDPKRERRERAFRSLLDMLLTTDPAYAALYREASQKLGEAELEADRAMVALEIRRAHAVETLDDIHRRAARLPDGRRIYRTSSGVVLDEAGRPVSPVEAEGVLWPPNAPSYEEHEAARREAETFEQLLFDLRRHQVDVLGRWRDRLQDEERPPSKEELEALLQDLNARPPAVAAMVDAAELHRSSGRDEHAPSVSLQSSLIDVPEI